MVSSLARSAVCILIVLSAAALARSQNVPAKTANATITGKVTIKGKGAPGIVVAATDPNYGGPRGPRYRGRTDDSGNYRINLPPGTYQVMPVPLAWVIESQQTNLTVVVNDGETIEDFNFALARGGVITGKVTDADGKPLIDESVSLSATSSTSGNVMYSSTGNQTDDRGVYRIFGLSPGKYKVYVGQSDRGMLGSPGRNYRQTYYPSVTDEAKATTVDVSEGSEATGIDIVVGRPITGFRVSGRIVDGETGKPLPNVMYGIAQITDHGRYATSGEMTNARGEFRFENLTPGKYSAFVEGGEDNVRGESLSFEVVDHDIADLVLKTSRGASISGVVVFEGVEDKPGANKFERLYVNAWMPNPELDFMNNSSTSVKADGSFLLRGLRSGIPNLRLAVMGRGGSKNPVIVRIERDGVPQSGGINVKDGEHVTGVRLVAKYLTGAIRGQVTSEDGSAIPASRISVWLERVDNSRAGSQRMSGSSSQVDSRGRFIFEGLAAGIYEINVALYDSGRFDSTQITKQQVTVVDNAVSEVTVTLKPKP